MIKHFVPLSTRHPINCFASVEPWQAMCAINENTTIQIQYHFMVFRMQVGESYHGQAETGRSQVKVNGLLKESGRLKSGRSEC